MIEAPQSFIVASECEKAAWQNGFRRKLGEQAGWARFGSTTAEGTLALAAAGPRGPWLLALDHAGVIEALREEASLQPADLAGPGLARYMFESLTALYAILPRLYQLAASLPEAPLQEFQAKVRSLPETTEVERLTRQRIGQDIFRTSLLDYWQGSCPLTGITDKALLRASHIIPWRNCATHDPTLLRKAFLDTYGILVLIALPTAIGLGLTAEYYVPLLLGSLWSDAVPLIEILRYQWWTEFAKQPLATGHSRYESAAPRYLGVHRPCACLPADPGLCIAEIWPHRNRNRQRCLSLLCPVGQSLPHA